MADVLTEVLNDPEVHEVQVKVLKAAALGRPLTEEQKQSLGFYARFVTPRAQKLAAVLSEPEHSTMTPAEEAALMDELTTDYEDFKQKQLAETTAELA